MTYTYLVQLARANSDNNGNGRHVYVLYGLHADRTNPFAARLGAVNAYWTGGSTSGAVRRFAEMHGVAVEHFGNVVELPSIDVEVRQYRELIDMGERFDPSQPYRVEWIDDGTIYAFAHTRAKALRLAAEYNKPWRNEGPRVKVSANDRADLVADDTRTAGYTVKRGDDA